MRRKAPQYAPVARGSELGKSPNTAFFAAESDEAVRHLVRSRTRFSLESRCTAPNTTRSGTTTDVSSDSDTEHRGNSKPPTSFTQHTHHPFT